MLALTLALALATTPIVAPSARQAPQTPSCTALRALFTRLDAERTIARQHDDLVDVAKITARMLVVRAQLVTLCQESQ